LRLLSLLLKVLKAFFGFSSAAIGVN